ncbi:ADP-ribose glycohydrolase MACROD2-like [Oppia nitens]|uniref:ADP-ribose glycohydrolase MACROD2-like n=1 Tax=Oppia nitens TaxID=1686743 RepID=UPI0023DBCD35|nr:ADP-ribose glycohydrolase MACROD2-like [Oppia nitens]
MIDAECRSLNGCQMDVIHAVGPVVNSTGSTYSGGSLQQPPNNDHLLVGCYQHLLDLVAYRGWKSVAIPCISAGAKGYPHDRAGHIALRTVRQWLESNPYASRLDRVIFCLYQQQDLDVYTKLMIEYFPVVQT